MSVMRIGNRESGIGNRTQAALMAFLLGFRFPISGSRLGPGKDFSDGRKSIERGAHVGRDILPQLRDGAGAPGEIFGRRGAVARTFGGPSPQGVEAIESFVPARALRDPDRLAENPVSFRKSAARQGRPAKGLGCLERHAPVRERLGLPENGRQLVETLSRCPRT